MDPFKNVSVFGDHISGELFSCPSHIGVLSVRVITVCVSNDFHFGISGINCLPEKGHRKENKNAFQLDAYCPPAHSPGGGRVLSPGPNGGEGGVVTWSWGGGVGCRCCELVPGGGRGCCDLVRGEGDVVT